MSSCARRKFVGKVASELRPIAVGVAIVAVLTWVLDLLYDATNAWLDSAGFQRIDYDALGAWCGLLFVIAMAAGSIIAIVKWLKKTWHNSKAECGEGVYE